MTNQSQPPESHAIKTEIHSHSCLSARCCLDDGIASVVSYLRQAGLETFASCAGLSGHAFAYPMVRIQGSSVQEIFSVLDQGGYDGYFIKQYHHCWHRSSSSFYEIEFWGLSCTQPKEQKQSEHSEPISTT